AEVPRAGAVLGAEHPAPGAVEAGGAGGDRLAADAAGVEGRQEAEGVEESELEAAELARPRRAVDQGGEGRRELGEDPRVLLAQEHQLVAELADVGDVGEAGEILADGGVAALGLEGAEAEERAAAPGDRRLADHPRVEA